MEASFGALHKRRTYLHKLNAIGYFGSGLDENVCAVYFLAHNYKAGDEVFVFGFLHGAYTARATAGLVARVGLCQDIQVSQLWEIYSGWKRKDSTIPIGETPSGKLISAVADQTEKDVEEEDWINFAPGNRKAAPYRIKKGTAYW